MSPRARPPTAPDPHTGGPSRFPLVTVEEALATLRRFRAVAAERIPVADAPGRVLARDVRTTLDLPHFERSYMDGFAVRARDTAGASTERPVRLAVVVALLPTTAQLLLAGAQLGLAAVQVLLAGVLAALHAQAAQ